MEIATGQILNLRQSFLVLADDRQGQFSTLLHGETSVVLEHTAKTGGVSFLVIQFNVRGVAGLKVAIEEESVAGSQLSSGTRSRSGAHEVTSASCIGSSSTNEVLTVAGRLLQNATSVAVHGVVQVDTRNRNVVGLDEVVSVNVHLDPIVVANTEGDLLFTLVARHARKVGGVATANHVVTIGGASEVGLDVSRIHLNGVPVSRVSKHPGGT